MSGLVPFCRCREGRENRPQSRCGNGSQFHNVKCSDASKAKSIRGQPRVKASEKGVCSNTQKPGVRISRCQMLTPISPSGDRWGTLHRNNEGWDRMPALGLFFHKNKNLGVCARSCRHIARHPNDIHQIRQPSLFQVGLPFYFQHSLYSGR